MTGSIVLGDGGKWRWLRGVGGRERKERKEKERGEEDKKEQEEGGG